MKINDANISGTSVPAKTDAAQLAQQTARNQGNAKSGGSPGDQVEISGLAGRVAKALAASDRSRVAYVHRLAETVRSGDYQIDPKVLSRSLVDEALSRPVRSR